MRVLIIRISPGTIGGAELSAFDQAVALKDLGHEPILTTNLRPLMKRATKEDIKIVWFPWINRGPNKLLRQIIFIGLIPFTYLIAVLIAVRFRPDIINPHSREDQNAFTFTKWIHKKPVIWKDAGDLRNHLAAGNGSYLRLRSQKKQIQALQQADFVYFLNESDQSNAVDIAGDWLENKSIAIPASILYRYYNRNIEAQKPDGKLIIGSLARLEENKGLQYLIEAVKQLGERGNVEYWLVGHGGYRGAYKMKLKNMASDYPSIKFKPYTSDVSEYLATFDVLVHPAEIEGWGRIIKEGMYFGLPIIGSDVGGIALQIDNGKTGLLFEVGNVNELKLRLEKLISDKRLREKLGRAAKQQAEKDGDFVKIVQYKIIPLYEKFLRQ